MEAGSAPSAVSLFLLVVAYVTMNTTLNLCNRWALGIFGFRFPFFLTTSHMVFGFLALLPWHLSHDWEGHKSVLRRQWKGLAAIGAFLATGISLNNISLVYITLSLNQVIRSSIPVVACILSVVVEGRRPCRAEALSLVVLSAGVMVAVWEGSVAGRPLGIAFCMLGTLSSGAMVTFSGKLLSEKLNVLSLTFFTAPVSLLCLAPFFATYEMNRFSSYSLMQPQAVALIVAVSSINALAYNVCHYLMIQRLSAVGTTVVGEVKIVGLMLLSAALLGEGKEFTLKMTVGCGLALAGFCLYSHTKIQAYRENMLAASCNVASPPKEAPAGVPAHKWAGAATVPLLVLDGRGGAVPAGRQQGGGAHGAVRQPMFINVIADAAQPAGPVLPALQLEEGQGGQLHGVLQRYNSIGGSSSSSSSLDSPGSSESHRRGLSARRLVSSTEVER